MTYYVDSEGHSIGHTPEIPVAVTIQHRFDSADPAAFGPAVIANVRTRWRQARGEPVATSTSQHVTDAARECIRHSAAQAGNQLRPDAPELSEHLRRTLRGWSQVDVTVDGMSMRWEIADTQDYATGEQLHCLGGAVGATLIAVVGPEHLLATVALRLHGTQRS